MPTKYIHFTDEQKEQARRTDLADLLRSQGESLKRSGSEYEWRDGSQKVTIRGNLWFHQYEQKGGDAIDFVRRFYNKSYPEAMVYLLGGASGVLTVSPPIEKKTAEPFVLPEKNDNMRRVYSLATIADDLTADGIPTPAGKEKWHRERIASILTNERYKGDAIINKTFIVDCISKKVKVNNGERPKYYVENNHPAIIDPGTFGRVQEEMARRNGKRKVKQLGTKTEQGKYSSKYALTDLLICGECGTPYRRCTWTNNGKKKVVWRCISRLDYGKKHCHNSPSVEESILQEAIMNAIMRTAKQNADVLRTLKLHIGMGLAATDVEDNSLDIQIRIAEIDAEFKAMLQAVATDTMDAFDEEKAGRLMNEKAELQKQLDRISETKQKRENAKSRLEEIFMILEGLNNHPMTYDDKIVRQIIECVVVESKERIKVVFVGGTEVTEPLG